nr:FkbM family methyltransferase [Oscillospiraceae bacterium]
ERETLLGSKKTIIDNHPILAVCVYHKPDDLFKLREIIQSMDEKNEYSYYLRYYGPDLRELVLYAI